jgi:hypothetical protein
MRSLAYKWLFVVALVGLMSFAMIFAAGKPKDEPKNTVGIAVAAGEGTTK